MSTDLRQLSEREQEILRLVAAGLSNQQIANRLGVSINTVKVHLRNVFGKIGAASRTEATMYAVRAGIVTVERPAGTTTDEPGADDVEVQPEALTSHLTEVELAEPPTEAITVDAIATEELVPPFSEVLDPGELIRQPTTGRLPLRALAAACIVLALVAAGVWFLRRPQPTLPTTSGQSTEPTRWKSLPPMRHPRAAFAVASIGDLLYIIGGQNEGGVQGTVERYDTRAAIWTDLSKKPVAVAEVHGVVIGGKIYIPGGRRSADPKDITAAFERYDPRAEVWETLPNLPEPRSAYGLAAVEGKLYLFGGWDGRTYRNDVFEYDPERNSWRTRTPMPTARAYAEAAVIEDTIYVLGGENASGALDSNEVYSPSQEGAQPWTRRPPISAPRTRFGAVVTLSDIQLFGGTTNDGPLAYNVRNESWASFTAPPTPIGSQPGVILQDVTILVLGGQTQPNTYSATMQSYQALYTIALPIQQ